MPQPTARRSFVWKFFDLAAGKKSALCTFCKKEFKYHGNTSNLKEHIKRIHSLQFQVENECAVASISQSTETGNVATLTDILDQIDSLPVVLNNNVQADDSSTKLRSGVKRKWQLQPKASDQTDELEEDETSSHDEAVVEMVIKDFQPAKRSAVWTFFDLDAEKQSAVCRFCQKKIKYHRTTSNLKAHISRVHPVQFQVKDELAVCIETGNDQVIELGEHEISSFDDTVSGIVVKDFIWNFFDLDAENKSAVCKICKKNIKFNKNTSDLKEHIKSVHPFQFQVKDDELAANIPQSSQKDGISCHDEVGMVVTDTRKPAKRSVVWNFFDLDKEKKLAVCRICKKTFKYYGNTSNMKEHLKRIHPVHLKKVEDECVAGISQSSQREDEISCPDDTVGMAVKDIPLAAKKSVVWKFFDSDAEKISAVCRMCKKRIMSHGNTSNLKEHIRRVHPLQLTLEDECTENPQSCQRGNVTKLIGQIHELREIEISDLDEAVVGMVVKDFQPLSIVEDTGFRNLVQKLNPRYTLPSRKTLSDKLLPTYYESIREKLFTLLKNVEYISITADYWKSNSNRTYLSMAAHYIYEDKLHAANLSTKEVEGPHTGTNSVTVIEEICDSWEINSKIVAVVTNSGVNMTKVVMEELKTYHHPCFVHIINQTVNDAIYSNEELLGILAKCRALMSYFKHSFESSHKLKEKQAELNLPQLALKQDISGRWNSTYTMLEQMLTFREPLSVVITGLRSENAPENLTENEWSTIQDCLHTLKLFLEFTEEMSADKYMTMSILIPLVRGLQYAIKSVTPTAPIGQRFKQTLTKMVADKLSHLETNKIVSMSTFLDPRFKKTGFGNGDNARNAQQWVIEELAGILSQGAGNKESTESQPLAEGSSNSKAISLWSDFDKQVSQQTTCETPNATAIIMVRQYVETNVLSRKFDPLKYWKDHGLIFPELYLLAKKYLSIPASSVPSERLFSKAGYVLSDRRNLLSSAKLDEIIFLNSNIGFI